MSGIEISAVIVAVWATGYASGVFMSGRRGPRLLSIKEALRKK
jgi:hypothetical protein